MIKNFKRFLLTENVDQEINDILNFINTQVIKKPAVNQQQQPTQAKSAQQPIQQTNTQEQQPKSNMNRPSVQNQQQKPKNVAYQQPTNEPTSKL